MLERHFATLRRTCWRMDALPPLSGPIAIWGAGTRGRELRRAMERRGVTTAFFIDNDIVLQDEFVDGVPVLPLELAARRDPLPVCISVELGYDMAMRLRRLGVEDFYCINKGYRTTPFPVLQHEAEILRVLDLLADEESRTCYLAALHMRATGRADTMHPSPYHQNKHPVVKPAHGDIIINGGGYVGNVASDFARLTHRDCTIYSFEPIPKVYTHLTDNIAERGLTDIVTTVNKALWSETGLVGFTIMESSRSGSSRATEESPQRLPAVDLDSFVRARRLPAVDLIEMDVEGSEPQALAGAVGVITRFRPKLQISLYHAPEHLWELPLFIHQLVPDYSFYIGHHSHAFNETMLYAVVP